MDSIIRGAIIGGAIGLAVVLASSNAKNQKYKKLLKTLTGPVDYSGLYHYASYKRFKSSFKFFDNYGILYLTGKTVTYKTSESQPPLSFNLDECSVQAEPDWRMLKWFSITTPAGEKFYFNSSKTGALKNNSEETTNGLQVLQARKAGTA